MADLATYHSKVRVIDWYRAITLTAIPLIVAFFVVSDIGSMKDRTLEELFLVALCLLALWFAKVHFSGTIFDAERDTLTFPTFLFARTIRLSEIRDGNIANLRRPYAFPNFGLVAGGKGPKTIRSTKWIYAVDLSGDFGGRQVKFWSRKRRDQFLSNLRHLCPKCRITRWPGGYGEY